MSDEFLGLSLFQPKHYVGAGTVSINSNTDAEIFIALFIEDDRNLRDGGLMEALPADGWTLKDGLYLEWDGGHYGGGIHRLSKVWSKNIKAGETISFTSTKGQMSFAILMKRGIIFV